MGGGIAPKEEDCEPAFAAPETYYMKILTGRGFTTKQRLNACLGFANWLEFKGLSESAEEMLRWGVDIAKSGLPIPPDAVLDARTNVIKEDGGKEATPNLLRATTALATHHARTGDTAAALPIFLSVLRARRSTPTVNFKPALEDMVSSDTDILDPRSGGAKQSDIGAGIAFIRKLFTPTAFPPSGPSGDEPLIRDSDKPTCEEAELMLYVGEILFASGGENQHSTEGVRWTRQAVKVAEANLETERLLRETGRRSPSTRDGKEQTSEEQKCKECLVTGTANWETMLHRLLSQQHTSSAREGGRDAGFLEWRGWFGGTTGGVKGRTLEEAGVGVLEEELGVVGRLKEVIAREGMEGEGGTGEERGRVGSTWMG